MVNEPVPEALLAADIGKRTTMQSKPHFEQRPDEDVQDLLKQLARSVSVRTVKHPYVKV